MNPSLPPMFETYLDRYVLKGGIVMVALIPCSIMLLSAMIQAAIRLRRGRVAPTELLSRARDAVDAATRLSLLRLVREGTSPLALATRQIIERYPPDGPPPTKQQIETAAGEAIAYEADDLYDSLNIFATLYTVAPLLGLLGTILGMIHAFEVFGSQDVKDLKLLSDGIQEALITTLWGLGVAIPAFIAAQHFQGIVRRYEREELPDKIMPILDAVYDSHGAGAQAGGIRGAEGIAVREHPSPKDAADSWHIEGDQP